MTLGERITALRAAQGLSQADLAAQLDVSRQSVSKWETDASVPELDKLVRLSALFSITLDELVTGTAPQPGPAAEPGSPAPAAVSPARGLRPRQIVGLVLLGVGLLVTLLLAGVGAGLWGLWLASPLLLSGAVCLLIARHTLLWALWAAFAPVYAYLRYATGIRAWWVFHSWIYGPEFGLAHPLIAWTLLLVPLSLLIATAAALLRDWRRRRTA